MTHRARSPIPLLSLPQMFEIPIRLREKNAMRPLSGSLYVLAILLLAAACGDSSTGPDGSRRFTVTYEVSGTFDSCTVFYITRRDDVEPDQENEGGDSRSEDTALPWSHTFDVTVTEMRPFNTLVRAVCTASSALDVTAVLEVDGEERDRATESGQNVNAGAEAQLTIDG